MRWYPHEVGHDLDDLLHGGPLGGVLGPAARHQALDGLGQVLDERGPRAWGQEGDTGLDAPILGLDATILGLDTPTPGVRRSYTGVRRSYTGVRRSFRWLDVLSGG